MAWPNRGDLSLARPYRAGLSLARPDRGELSLAGLDRADLSLAGLGEARGLAGGSPGEANQWRLALWSPSEAYGAGGAQ